MNPKIKRTYADIERCKRKITELETHVQEQEMRVKVMENEEIARRLRAITNDPDELAAILNSIDNKTANKPIKQINDTKANECQKQNVALEKEIKDDEN
jgi:glutamyl-tRNA reductase